ncbi:MAG: MBL fold metallo-hydrolase [Anaerolineae bacterium]|nr:MBL fold metallo-hydrolase [Anaerolineae bacterium]
MPDTLIQVAHNIWIFPRDEDPNRVQPNVGVIIAGGHTVLVDAGNSPRHARRVLLALDDVNAPPVSHVIYTHSHWDHVFGAMVFGAPAIAHELCRKQLVETAAKPWSHGFIQEEIQRTPAREVGLRALGRAIEDWRSFRIVLPEIVLSKTLCLHFGEMTIDIEHVGGQHAPDSLVVRLPEAGVMFTADCYYPPSPVRYTEDDFDADMIASLLDDDIDLYIDGHGNPRTRTDMGQLVQKSRQGDE